MWSKLPQSIWPDELDFQESFLKPYVVQHKVWCEFHTTTVQRTTDSCILGLDAFFLKIKRFAHESSYRSRNVIKNLMREEKCTRFRPMKLLRIEMYLFVFSIIEFLNTCRWTSLINNESFIVYWFMFIEQCSLFIKIFILIYSSIIYLIYSFQSKKTFFLNRNHHETVKLSEASVKLAEPEK